MRQKKKLRNYFLRILNLNNMKKGFTLIELLVVIAIIGIITATVLASVHNVHQGEISAASTTLLEPTGYVVDSSNVLDADVEEKLTAQLKSFDSKAQIAVVTIPSVKPLSIEEYSIKLAEKWKVGHAGTDTGIIFLIATEDRDMRIEVGRGFEGSLNDAKAGVILRDEVTPFFKKGDWNDGVVAGVNAIINTINK